jgi:hypothetical protein
MGSWLEMVVLDTVGYSELEGALTMDGQPKL